MTTVQLERTPAKLHPDKTRTIVKRFIPAGGAAEDGTTRLQRLLARILGLEESEIQTALTETLGRFSHRHRNFSSHLESHFAVVAHEVPGAETLSKERRLLIGAYLTHEYSLEAAALSNPSIVLAPDQSGIPPGAARIVLSLRSIGEGHVSSIEFRTGMIDENGAVAVDAPGPFPVTARPRSARYVKYIFREKLKELQVYSDTAATVLEPLGEEFSMDELNARIDEVNRSDIPNPEMGHATHALHWLAASNYEISFSRETHLSERVLFPAAPIESSGMEDARFVRFTNDDASVTYYATYTAYDGYQILPQLIETTDLLNFRIATLNGHCARNKGIALFPRKLNGKYAALARLDNENNFFMTSDDVRFWHQSEVIQRPSRPWELTHIGNCGSPLETEAGWLVITHGVGAMRQYGLGAILLDLNDPTKVIGSLREPLLEPDENEREGYVPNVVYSCGSLITGGRLILPYGFSDSGTAIASLEVNDLLTELTHPRSATR